MLPPSRKSIKLANPKQWRPDAFGFLRDELLKHNLTIALTYIYTYKKYVKSTVENLRPRRQNASVKDHSRALRYLIELVALDDRQLTPLSLSGSEQIGKQNAVRLTHDGQRPR